MFGALKRCFIEAWLHINCSGCRWRTFNRRE